MLCLKCDTKPAWITSVLKNIPSIINDHLHAEKKAAATGISLLTKYFDRAELCRALAALAEEEMGHYRMVLDEMEKRGIPLKRDAGDDYARQLLQYIRKNEPQQMLDRLLIAGIIEARSCERLQILRDNLPELSEFYDFLAKSEAGHYMTYVKLAKMYLPEDEVRARLDELSQIEKDIVLSLPNDPVMHG